MMTQPVAGLRVCCPLSRGNNALGLYSPGRQTPPRHCVANPFKIADGIIHDDMVLCSKECQDYVIKLQDEMKAGQAFSSKWQMPVHWAAHWVVLPAGWCKCGQPEPKLYCTALDHDLSTRSGMILNNIFKLCSVCASMRIDGHQVVRDLERAYEGGVKQVPAGWQQANDPDRRFNHGCGVNGFTKCDGLTPKLFFIPGPEYGNKYWGCSMSCAACMEDAVARVDAKQRQQ